MDGASSRNKYGTAQDANRAIWAIYILFALILVVTLIRFLFAFFKFLLTIGKREQNDKWLELHPSSAPGTGTFC